MVLIEYYLTLKINEGKPAIYDNIDEPGVIMLGEEVIQ